MALGCCDHVLEQTAAFLLDVRPAGELGASVAKPERERVPHPLEVAGVEDTRPTDGADRPLKAAPRERRREQLAELALEPADLAAKVFARQPLGLARRRSERGRRHPPRLGSL
jgi:hypothetical protein